MARLPMHEVEVRHDGLNKFRHIRGSDRYVVEQKALAQKKTWDKMWIKKQAAEEKKREKEAAVVHKEAKTTLAIEKTREAEAIISDLENTLKYTLSVNDAIDWKSLLDKRLFEETRPKAPEPKHIPRSPNRTDESYHANLRLIDYLVPSWKRKKVKDTETQLCIDLSDWKKERTQLEVERKMQMEAHRTAVVDWEARCAQFLKEQKQKNASVVKRGKAYFAKDPEAISDYCEMVLSNSRYPDNFPQEWDLEYHPETGLLVVDYSLPSLDHLPKTKAVKYVASRDGFTETELSQSTLNDLYDSLLYQIALRTIHELYEADVIKVVDSIVFNGWVESVDKATGHDVTACILSLQASKDEFLVIKLENVDPKECFKQLKGVGSSKLHGMAPVAPLVQIDRKDARFVSSYDVVDGIDHSTNLAAMDWQDFENLIRELFEKEFVSNGGEVKITQASRDGGVDAVAFDPDPIRGGKIVIQAKRYTNVVGVAAVRDLYGTTVNEGANKGILVTTAQFGPDAYDFAKGKPLTLLSGNNLLHLLEKHGHNAKIDLQEAKQILAEQKKAG